MGVNPDGFSGTPNYNWDMNKIRLNKDDLQIAVGLGHVLLLFAILIWSQAL